MEILLPPLLGNFHEPQSASKLQKKQRDVDNLLTGINREACKPIFSLMNRK